MQEAGVKVRAPSDSQSGLPVIVILAASRNDAIALEAAASRCRLGAASKCSVLEVIANSIVDGQIATNLPAILKIQPIYVVKCVDESSAGGDRERSGSRGRCETFIFADVKLLEKRVIGEMADVETGFNGMGTVGPG